MQQCVMVFVQSSIVLSNRCHFLPIERWKPLQILLVWPMWDELAHNLSMPNKKRWHRCRFVSTTTWESLRGCEKQRRELATKSQSNHNLVMNHVFFDFLKHQSVFANTTKEKRNTAHSKSNSTTPRWPLEHAWKSADVLQNQDQSWKVIFLFLF